MKALDSKNKLLGRLVFGLLFFVLIWSFAGPANQAKAAKVQFGAVPGSGTVTSINQTSRFFTDVDGNFGGDSKCPDKPGTNFVPYFTNCQNTSLSFAFQLSVTDTNKQTTTQTLQNPNPHLGWVDITMPLQGTAVVTVTVTQNGSVIGTASTGSLDLQQEAKTEKQVENYQTGGFSIAKGILALVNSILQALALLVQYLVYWLFSLIVAPMVTAILRIQVHAPEFAAVILAGWVFLRNLMNVMFILIMLVIALGTLFRVSSLNYKDLLVKVVFMAILVNFSLVIARAILGIADTAQAQFLPANQDVIKNLAYQLMVTPQLINSQTFATYANGDLSITVNLLFNVFLTIASFFAFLAIAAFLIVRIVAVWLLLLTSPIAYAGSILPWTKRYASKWWGEFIRYAFFTPILGLMLHLCAVVAASESSFVQVMANGQFPNNPDASKSLYVALSNILIIICLMAAMYVAEHSGVVGAHAITGFAKDWTEKLTLKPAEYGAHTLYEGAQAWKHNKLSESGWIKSDNLAKRWAAKAMAPKLAWEGRQKRVHEQREEKKEHALAGFEQASWYRSSHGTVDLGQDRASLKETIIKKAKGFENKDIEQVEATMDKMMEEEGNLEERGGLIWHAATSDRLPEVLKNWRIKMNARDRDGHLTDKAKELRKKFGLTDMENDLVSHDNRKIVNGFLKADEDYASRVFIGETLNDWAKKNGRMDLIYGVVPDPLKPGEYINPDEYEHEVEEWMTHASEWEEKEKAPALIAELEGISKRRALKPEEQAELERARSVGSLTAEEKRNFTMLNALRPRVKKGDKLAKWYASAMERYEEYKEKHPEENLGDFRADSRLGLEKIDYLDGVSGENRAKARFRDDNITFVVDHYEEDKNGVRKPVYKLDDNGNPMISADGLAYLETYTRLETPAILKLSQKSLKDTVLGAKVDYDSSALIITEEEWAKAKAIYGGAPSDPSNPYAVEAQPEMANMITAIRHLSTGHSGSDRRGATGDGLLFIVTDEDGNKRYATIGGSGGVVHSSAGGDAIADLEGNPFQAGQVVERKLNPVEVGSKVAVPTTDQEIAAVKHARKEKEAERVVGGGTGDEDTPERFEDKDED